MRPSRVSTATTRPPSTTTRVTSRPRRGRREREGGRVRVGVAGLGLPRRAAHVVRDDAGEQAREVLGRDELGLDPEALLHRHVAAELIRVTAPDELHEADGLEAAVAPDLGMETLEDLQTLERQSRLVLVRVVHPDQRARLARRAPGQPAALEQDHVPDTEPSQLEGRARPVGTSSDDDDVSDGHSGGPIVAEPGTGRNPAGSP